MVNSANVSDTAPIRSARDEWRAAWPLPFIGSLGCSGTVMFVYAAGILRSPITADVGWSWTQFSTGITLLMFVGIIALPLVGFLVDRFGPRRMALIGAVFFPISIAALGAQSGTLWQWWLQCALNALIFAFISPSVWCAATASRFSTSRGLALGVTLSGTTLGVTLVPLLTTLYLQHFGWRLTFPALALTYALPLLPLVVVFFFPDRNKQRIRVGQSSFSTYRVALVSRPFLMLMFASGSFSLGGLTVMMNLSPILTEKGLSPITAASVAGLAGISAMIGRLSVGALMDRFSARTIGIGIFGLPAFTCLMLVYGGDSMTVFIASAVIMGVATGAEFDIIGYLISRYYAEENFGGLFGAMQAVISGLAGMGPLLGAWLIQNAGGYDALLLFLVPLFFVSGLAMIPLPELGAGAKVRRG